MNTLWLISDLVLWLVVLFLGFTLLGTLRVLGLLRWRLEQPEATTPSRLGRSGLRVGKKAPEFSLPSVTSEPIALHDFAGHKVLLVFTQAGCGPCHQIMPELNKLQRAGEVQVVVVNNGDADGARKLAEKSQARFPVLAQERFGVSRRYEVFATPFAFVIDEQGVIRSKGIVNNGRHLRFVVTSAGQKETLAEPELAEAEAVEA